MARSAGSTHEVLPSRAAAPAPESPPADKGTLREDNLDPQRPYLLPKDLAGALKRLSDGEIGALLAAATLEARRRGLAESPGKEKSAADQRPPNRLLRLEEIPLTTAKLNAVRAAFKAGVKLSSIA